MLFEANLSTGFWAEAALTATYLINRCPVSRLLDMTPEEAWSGIKPIITAFRPFGCPAYAHVPKANRTKLESKTRKCIMLGYEPGTKAYRLWDPKRRCIVKSRDVIFDERINPPAKPEPPVDLSEILWDGELEYKGITRVGDNWEDGVANHEHEAPVRASTPDDVAPEHHMNPPENDNLPPEVNPDPPAPIEEPAPAPAPRRARRSELDMLGPPPEVEGHRERRLPARYREEPDLPVGPPIAEVEEDLQDAEMAEIAFTFAAAAHSNPSEPQTFREAMQSPEAKFWTQAIQKEIQSLEDMGTFETVNTLPTGRKAIGSKLVFRIKHNTDGSIERYKARLVAKGFLQMPGIDFDETFAPVVKLTSIRIMCALAVRLKLHFHHLDVDTAFLNSPLQEEIYMRMPEGSGEHEGKIVRLHRSLYGLKQASRVWNELLDTELQKIGYIRIHADFCIYVYREGETILFLAVYVDDMGLLGNNLDAMQSHKRLLNKQFKIKDLGNIKQILGIAIDYNREGQTLHMYQTRYIDESAERYGFADGRTHRTPLASGIKLSKDDCPTTETEKRRMHDYPYQNLIGTLMYAMLATRPDIAFAVGALSKFSSNPGYAHWDQAVHTLRYLVGTKDYALFFDGNSLDDLSSLILGYTDSDWAGNIDTRRSTGGYVFLMCGAAVSWSSKLQSSPALSSTEAEYMACTRAAQEAIWLRQLLEQLGFKQTKPTSLLGDNQGAIALAKNPGNHPRTKHIALRYHFIRFTISNGHILLNYIPTSDMAADGLTKGLTGDKHLTFLHMLGLKSRPSGSVRIN